RSSSARAPRPGWRRGPARARSRSRPSSIPARFESFDEVEGPAVAGMLGPREGPEHAPRQLQRPVFAPVGHALDHGEAQPAALPVELCLRLLEESDGGGVELRPRLQAFEQGARPPKVEPGLEEVAGYDRPPFQGLPALVQ